MVDHIQIIQKFIDKYQYKSYLEIGIENAVCYNAIQCDYKAGVDPDPDCMALADNIYCLTSDVFFRGNNRKFDIIFVDGLHYRLQTILDIINSFACLNKGGTIIVHDCNPENEQQQAIPRASLNWCGDVWKAWCYFRCSGYKMYVVDTDYGVGIIRPDESQERKYIYNPQWRDFVNNKTEWLNLISVQEFETLLQ